MRKLIKRLDNGGDNSGGGKMDFGGSGNDPDTSEIKKQ